MPAPPAALGAPPPAAPAVETGENPAPIIDISKTNLEKQFNNTTNGNENHQKEPEQAMPPQHQLKSRIIQRRVKNDIHNLCGILSLLRAFRAADHFIQFINHALKKIEEDGEGLQK